jgi:hypothetical protein
MDGKFVSASGPAVRKICGSHSTRPVRWSMAHKGRVAGRGGAATSDTTAVGARQLQALKILNSAPEPSHAGAQTAARETPT